MSVIFDKSFWESILNIFSPKVILLLTQILMPFSIIIIFVIFILTYFFTKRFIVKRTFNAKDYLFMIIVSLLIYYILAGGFMLFIEIGLARISQYI